MNERQLTDLFNKAHNVMRNVDGLQPQEAFDELLKYLFFKEYSENEAAPIALQKSLLNDGTFGPNENRVAGQINKALSRYLKGTNSWTTSLWKKSKFSLSNHALLAVHEILQDVEWSQLSLDVRSNSVKGFLRPELRKGLGIFLTPDEIVRLAIELAQPKVGSKVCDPACGSGTFLLETLSYWAGKNKNSVRTVFGIEKNPRMFMLADLNLGHDPNVKFNGLHADSLLDLPGAVVSDEKLSANSFDFIFTNPPFGVNLDNRKKEYDKFDCFSDGRGGQFSKQQSEFVFIEQCFRLLKPGGTLAIILPKGVISNTHQQSESAREALQGLGYIQAFVSLPPETFATAGTQTTTALFIMRKYKKAAESEEKVKITYANIKNVGFDSTGRSRDGSELFDLPRDFLLVDSGKKKAAGLCTQLPAISKKRTFSLLRDLVSQNQPNEGGVRLEKIVSLVRTGRTPARKDYSDAGLFLIKVGNLSGSGINWTARDRNFVNEDQREKRLKAGIIVQPGDILLTSSAHSVVYIGKKVDIIDAIPEWVGGAASLVGEVMLIRPIAEKVDPYALLGFLRSPRTQETLQSMARGQTAHLHHKDLLELRVPESIISPTKDVSDLAALMRTEVSLANELNEIGRQSAELCGKLF